MHVGIGCVGKGRDHLIEPIHTSGLLLTGGASRRMGRDKARLELGGVPLAVRAARALCEVAYPVLAVGDEAGTGLDAISDPRQGPLVAFATGARALPEDAPVLLVACDLPFLSADLLREVASRLGAHDAVVPVVDGRDQFVCACYSRHAAHEALRLSERGARAMRDLIDPIDVLRFDASEYARDLMDLDTPEDYEVAKRILDGPV